MAACRCVVHGRVQGVGFRYWTFRTAQALGLSGWVRNLPNGTVELEARGDEHALNALQDALHTGPPYSAVTRVACSPLQDSPETASTDTEFAIRT